MSAKAPNPEFRTRLVDWLGQEGCAAFLAAIGQERETTIRINSKMPPLPSLPLGDEVPWCRPEGRVWLGAEPPSRQTAYLGGAYYIQEASAMLAVSTLKATLSLDGTRILDLAAAPGGKTTQAAELAVGGLVVANEVDAHRRQALIWNILRHRVDNTLVTGLQAHTLARMLPGYFDIVMLDAPCSGEGLMAKGQIKMADWGIGRVKRLAALQRTLLQQAMILLRPGGTLVYSTCTFSPEENEEQVVWLIQTGMEPVPVSASLPASPPLSREEGVLLCARRLWPHHQRAAGAFVALLRRPEGLPCGDEGAHTLVHPQSIPLPWPSTLDQEALYQKRGIITYLPYAPLPGPLYDAAIQVGTPLCDGPRGRRPQFGSHRFFPADRILDVNDETAAAFHRGQAALSPPAAGFWVLRWKGFHLGLVEKTRDGVVCDLPDPLRSQTGYKPDSMRSSSR